MTVMVIKTTHVAEIATVLQWQRKRPTRYSAGAQDQIVNTIEWPNDNGTADHPAQHAPPGQGHRLLWAERLAGRECIQQWANEIQRSISPSTPLSQLHVATAANRMPSRSALDI